MVKLLKGLLEIFGSSNLAKSLIEDTALLLLTRFMSWMQLSRLRRSMIMVHRKPS